MYRFLFLICVIIASATGQSLDVKVFCRGPVDQFNMSYDYMFTSFEHQLADIGPTCRTDMSPSDQLQLILTGCNYRHCTQIMTSPYFEFVQDLPWNSQLSIGLDLNTVTYYGSSGQPQNMYHCMSEHPDNHPYCLSIVQVESINCLNYNLNSEIKTQKCTPEWFYILISVISGLVLIVLLAWFVIWKFDLRLNCCGCRRYNSDYDLIGIFDEVDLSGSERDDEVVVGDNI